MKTEKEALAYLETTDAEFIKLEAEATAELRQVQSVIASHEAVLKIFRTTGQGIMEAVAARAWLEDLDRLLFPNQHAINAATAASQRENFLTFQSHRLANDARESYVRVHVEQLSTAIQAVITARSRNRDKWREKIAEQVQALEKRSMLGESLTVEEIRRGESLERILAESDHAFVQAHNELSKFRANPNMEHFNDARRLAVRMNFEDA